MKVISPERQRATLLHKIKQAFLDQYYEEQNKLIKEELYRIAAQNQSLLNAKTPTFMFEGVWYTYSPYYTVSWQDTEANRTLHPTLKSRVTHLVHSKDFVDLQDKAQIDNLLGAILSAAQCEYDINRLLPDPFYPLYLNFEEREILNSGSPMMPEQIDAFKQKNKAGYARISALALLNLLLPNT